MGRKRGTNGSRIRAEHAVIDQSLTWFVVHTLPLHEASAAEEFGNWPWTGGCRSIASPWSGAGARSTRRRSSSPRTCSSGSTERVTLDGGPSRCSTAATSSTCSVGARRWRSRLGPAGPVRSDRGRRRDGPGEAAPGCRVASGGEMRRILNGPFMSFFAEVQDVLSNGLVRAEVSLFGRATPVEFTPDQLGDPVAA